jgi:pilus assembly protein CpaF
VTAILDPVDPAGRVRARLALAPPPAGVPLSEHLDALALEACPLLDDTARADVVGELLAALTGLGVLEPFTRDPAVTEVMVNGDGRCWIEREGRVEATDLVLMADDVLRIVERVVAPLGLRLDRAAPMVDARLPDGARLHAVIPPIALDGPCLTIRRFGARTVPFRSFGVDPGGEALLREAIVAGANVVVAGGTGAGKTTVLNALGGWFAPSARVVTIEETAELRLPGDHVVRLEARPPNAEGAGAVSVRDLVRTALRMRPDRIVVGEVRGPEAIDMLQALNTGHAGSATTLHANGAAEALHRLESLAVLGGGELPLAAVRAQIAAAIDLVVVVARTRTGARRITRIAEVTTPGSRLGVIERWSARRGLADGPARRPVLRGED